MWQWSSTACGYVTNSRDNALTAIGAPAVGLQQARQDGRVEQRHGAVAHQHGARQVGRKDVERAGDGVPRAVAL